MDNNVFAPPKAVVADAIAPLPSAPKPRSVLVLQTLLAVMVVVLGFGLIMTVVGFTQDGRTDWFFALGYATFMGLVLGVLLLALNGSQRRKRHGRWLGALAIAALFAYEAIHSARGIAAGVAAGDTQEVIAQGIAATVILGLVGLWLYRFEFSARARAWFC